MIFTPHLLPIPRGILSTIYVYLKREMTTDEIQSYFLDYYKASGGCAFSRQSSLPEIQFSVHTNYCDLGFCLARDGRRLIVVSCLDNLLKGAAGQAVQNMNLMYGWDEAEGLAMKIVVKIGGAALEDKPTLQKCAKAVVQLARRRTSGRRRPRRWERTDTNPETPRERQATSSMDCALLTPRLAMLP